MTSSSSVIPQEWKPQLLRLTGFLAPTETPQTENWWSHVAGALPENRVSKPAQGESSDSGSFHGQTLTLSVQPGRFDWYISADLNNPQSAPNELMILGEFKENLSLFLDTFTQWLKDCPPVLRVAYGAVLLFPAADRVSGYKKLSEYLPGVEIDAQNSRDFFYQVNRPRPSRSHAQVQLNRLSKWSVAAAYPLRLTLGPGVASYSQKTPEISACRLELDISTPVNLENELPHETLPDYLAEFSELGNEIAVKGDIR